MAESHTTPESKPRRPRRGGSLRRRLPLIISIFLVAIVGGGGTASYLKVREAVLDAARGRLQGNARQWSRLLAQSMTGRAEEARRAAARPAFQRRLVAADADAVAAAQQQANAMLGSPPQLLIVELWSAAGERLTAAVAPPSPDGLVWPANQPAEAPRSSGLKPLQARGDLLYSELVVDVAAPPDASDPASRRGFLVIRRLAAAPTAGRALARLIGEGNTLRLGSRESGVWTNLARRVDVPPRAADGAIVAYRGSDGATWLGTEAAIAGTPWALWVETPEAVALAPAYAFWNAMLPIGGLFVVLGALLAWVVGRRITTPLYELTGAAEAIAAGDLSRRVKAERSDEVGRLAEAFNAMADQVQAGYSRLDSGIRERTAELEQALGALHETQEQLVRREKLAMLGQLASGVGHELRNPLGVMTNAVYYLDMVQTDAPPDVQEYHGILRAQIGLAEKIVSDLLDFSRAQPPRRDVVAIADIVTAQRARLTVPPGVSVHVDVPDTMPAVSVDAVQIGQILFNLLVNAVQVLEGRGGTVTIGATTSDTHVAVHVQDDGPGVPADLRTKIFEPLFTTKARGIGLGLAVSKSLAESNGGALTLDDGAAGARFTLTLPRASLVEAA
jgi:signal transduction histidine kinase